MRTQTTEEVIFYKKTMCQKCYTQNIRSFPSYWDFDSFNNSLAKKIVIGTLFQYDNYLNSNYPKHLDGIYKCLFCGEIWFFSQPENSWRGYWITKGEFDKRKKIDLVRDKWRIITWLFILLCVFLFVKNNFL